MAVTKDMLVSELQDLLRLTAFEQTVANVRRLQAAEPAVAEELKANAEKSVERQQLLSQAISAAGGVPDVVGSAFGRVGAFLQTQVNQVQTLQGALLGDLALEHALRERARYARTVAQTLGNTQVLPVLDRLEQAHTATIAWLEQRLDEVARTGTSALRPTPLQAAVGVWRSALGVPLGLVTGTVNRTSSLLRRGGARTAEAASEAAGAASETARKAAGSVAETASDAAGAAADTTRRAAGAAAGTVSRAADTAAQTTGRAAETAADRLERAAEAVEKAADDSAEQVLDLTDVDESQEPFAAYDKLAGDSIIRHAADSEDVEHLREILAYEQAHKDRKGVVQAVEQRLTELSTRV